MICQSQEPQGATYTDWCRGDIVREGEVHSGETIGRAWVSPSSSVCVTRRGILGKNATP